MSSHPAEPATEEKDPANQLWHRMPVRRLEGEAVRDSILALSGRLDKTMFGPPVPIHLTEFMEGRGRPDSSGPLDGAGRRSIYIEVRRNFVSPMMRAFDTPVPHTTIGRRTVSNVPAQSLILMNDPFVIGQAQLWARRVLFPFVARCADDLCVIRSMVSEFSEHTNANYFLHTGLGVVGRPSMGAWASYGLGSENQNLPGFVVVNGGLIPPGGLENFGSGFLPPTFQGSIFRAAAQPVANIQPTEARPELEEHKLAFLRKLDAGALDRLGHDDQVESAIANYELAFRMRSAVPELMATTGESEPTRQLYGLDAAYPQTRTFGLQCLLARRLVERGVRFIELTCPATGGDRWDQHSNLKTGHENNARAVDQPIAGLLRDLKARGLLDHTLVVWAGEFGRTPFAQGMNGRDHNPFGFSIWMAGGGVKGGITYGATDDYGYKAVENKVHLHDFHATMLHLLGIDHTRLTVRYSGRDMRLTDVFGEVVRRILA